MTSRLRWGVLLWIVVSQFPLPMAHAHEDHGNDSGAQTLLNKHLQKHHAGESLEPNAVHWHFVIPWELACGLGDEDDVVSPPPACCCSGEVAFSTLDSALGDLARLPIALGYPTGEVLQPALNAPPDALRGSGFLQSFGSVRSSQLTCVFLS